MKTEVTIRETQTSKIGLKINLEVSKKNYAVLELVKDLIYKRFRNVEFVNNRLAPKQKWGHIVELKDCIICYIDDYTYEVVE